MKPGQLYLHNIKDEIIEIIVVRPKNKIGVAEICWSTMNSKKNQGLIEMEGQFGWTDRPELSHNYTLIGEL